MASKTRFWKKLDGRVVQCGLCPRNCIIPENRFGFCRTRKNVSGRLVSQYFGAGLPLSVETIESEGVFHYWPGNPILCVGNVGCMLRCSFCQNWQTSQIIYLKENSIHYHTPQDIVDTAERNGIDVISWTYNDPVVWHEFVTETSRIARQNNIKILYKSSLFIEPGPLEELLDCVDIFSISLKSVYDEFYESHTGGGKVSPVLNGIKDISRRKDVHLEISQLLVTGLNDHEQSVRDTCQWILDEIGSNVPLHFVGFHPAFKYIHEKRTSPEVISRSCQIAKDLGVKWVYSGNLMKSAYNNSACFRCGSIIIDRNHSRTEIIGLDESGNCTCCGEHLDHIIVNQKEKSEKSSSRRLPESALKYTWKAFERSAHLLYDGDRKQAVIVERIPSGSCDTINLNQNIGRYIINRNGENEMGLVIHHHGNVAIAPLLDRAHYPI